MRMLAAAVGIVARQVGEETVIRHLESGTHYGLDPVGARIWQLLVEGKSLAEVCGVMVEEYDVEAEQIEKDLMDLAGELEEKGLVRRLPSECHTTD